MFCGMSASTTVVVSALALEGFVLAAGLGAGAAPRPCQSRFLLGRHHVRCCSDSYMDGWRSYATTMLTEHVLCRSSVAASKGVTTYLDGSRYEGHFKDGAMHGKVNAYRQLVHPGAKCQRCRLQ